MAIVYTHSKPNGEVFYVGIGVTKKRAKSVHGRNRHWHNTVNKFGYNINILFDDVDYDTAKQCESYLIKYYGRKDLGLGSLVNFTDGGEGYTNMNQEEREKRSKRLKEYNKNEKDYSFTQNPEYRSNMRKSLIGKNSKRVINEKTRQIYSSLKEAAINEKINYTVLSSVLNGSKKNKTDLRWI
jgi:hypothetical protein